MASHLSEDTQQVTDQNLIPRLSDLHALNHNSFLPSKTHTNHSTNSGRAWKKLQVLFRAGDAVVNMRSPCGDCVSLAADELMGKRQTLKAPSLLKVMRAR